MNLRRRESEWERVVSCNNKYIEKCTNDALHTIFHSASTREETMHEENAVCCWKVFVFFFVLDASVNSLFRVAFKEFFFVLLWNLRAVEKNEGIDERESKGDSKWHEAMLKKEGKFIFERLVHVRWIISHAKRVDCKTLFFRCNFDWCNQSREMLF